MGKGWKAPDFSKDASPQDFSKDASPQGFSDQAPSHRIIGPGLNVEGECLGDKNSSCAAKGKKVWCKLGKGDFDMILTDKVECPLCKSGLKDTGENLGYYQCTWKMDAVKMDAVIGMAVKMSGPGLSSSHSGDKGFKTWDGDDSTKFIEYRKLQIKVT